MPPNAVNVPRLMMMTGSLKKLASRPLAAPSTVPSTIPRTAASQGFMPSRAQTAITTVQTA